MNFLSQDIIIPNAFGQPANGNSMAGNIISQPVICQKLFLASFGLSWTGTSPVGTVSIEGSNDFYANPNGYVTKPGTWSTLYVNYEGSVVPSIAVTGNTGNGIIDVGMTGIYALRLVYTATSGTGKLICTFCGKG